MKHPSLNLKAIVFDFDGTMATLNVDFAEMRHRIMDHLSAYRVPAEPIGHLFILEMIEKARDFIAQKHPGEETRYYREAMQLIRQIELQAASDAQLFDHTEAMLRELKRRKIKTGVVTRNCQAALERVFPEIYTAVDIVLTRDHTSRVKPDPEHLQQALRELDSPPAKSAMVGDHPMDIQLGRAVGVTTIGVLTGSTGRERLEASGASLILNQASDIIDFLQ